MRTVLAILVLLCAVPASAQITITQTKSDRLNDVSVTVPGGNVATGKYVFAAVFIESRTVTVTIDNWAPGGVVTVVPQTVPATATGAFYLFCFPGDGTDDTFTATSVGAATNVNAFAIVAENLPCSTSEDDLDSEEQTADVGSPFDYSLTTPLTLSTTTDHLTLSCFFGLTGGFTMDAGSTGTVVEDQTSAAVCRYEVVGGSGSDNFSISMLAEEDRWLVGVALFGAVNESGGGTRNLLLRGVGE